jgi:hypothetical protein
VLRYCAPFLRLNSLFSERTAHHCQRFSLQAGVTTAAWFEGFKESR